MNASDHPDTVDRAYLGSLPPDVDPRIAQLKDYWESIRPAPHLVPSRGHFDPSAMPKVLRWIYLLDVQRNPMRFRYRLLGTGHTIALGGDHTGKFIDDARSNFAGSVSQQQHIAVAEGASLAYIECPAFLSKPGGSRRLRRLLLPLAEADQVVNMILGLCFYSDLDPEWSRTSPR